MAKSLTNDLGLTERRRNHEGHVKASTPDPTDGTTPRFVDVGRLDHIVDGTAVVVTISGTTIAVVNIGGRLYALDDSCVRCGSSLAAGLLRGTQITCPRCDWRYDVTNGQVNGVPALRTDTFEVRTVGCHIIVADQVKSS